MEKRARDYAMARELQLNGLTAIQRPACSTAKNPGSCSIEVKTIFRWEVENAEMSYNILQFDPILVTQPFSRVQGLPHLDLPVTETCKMIRRISGPVNAMWSSLWLCSGPKQACCSRAMVPLEVEALKASPDPSWRQPRNLVATFPQQTEGFASSQTHSI